MFLKWLCFCRYIANLQTICTHMQYVRTDKTHKLIPSRVFSRESETCAICICFTIVCIFITHNSDIWSLRRDNVTSKTTLVSSYSDVRGSSTYPRVYVYMYGTSTAPDSTGWANARLYASLHVLRKYSDAIVSFASLYIVFGRRVRRGSAGIMVHSIYIYSIHAIT